MHVRRHTKIVATLGPASAAPEVLDRLLEAGVDVVRLNCSHGDHDDLRRGHAAVRDAAARAGRYVGVLFDLQGPKLRLAKDTAPRNVRTGEGVGFVGDAALAEPGDLVVGFADFVALVTERSQIVIGDGVPRFAVDRIDGARVLTRALTPGAVSARKGVNVTYARPNLPAITEKDAADLLLAAELGADFVALSFVRSADDVADLTDRLRAAGSRARTIAKIEKIEAYEALDAILEVADGVMVARGDYGVEAGVERVPLMQKDVIYRATQVGKAVITATQLLESMIHSPEPTRAEAADVANAVIDGTSAVMLSAETGVGEYPVEAVQAMAKIAFAAEESPVVHGRARRAHPDTVAATLLHYAVHLGEDLGVAALVIPTATGGGARACAKYRTGRPIVALVHDPVIGRQLALEWGVLPVELPVADNVEDLVEDALLVARDAARLPSGAAVVVTRRPPDGHAGRDEPRDGARDPLTEDEGRERSVTSCVRPVGSPPVEDATGRADDLRDIELVRRIQVVCAWCGVGFVVLLFGGWGLIANFIPLIPPSADAAEVAEIYSRHADLRRAGLVLGMVGVFLTVPFFLVISLQMRRAERRTPVLAILQFASGLIVTVVLMIPMLLFVGAAFRPERPAELTRLVNDLSYLMLILPWPPIIGQLVALAVATLADRRPRPVFPRWSAFFNLWVALLLTPATLIVFFQSGPFSWAGLVAFWVPAAVFGAWYPVMTWLLLRAIAAEAEEARGRSA